MFTQFIPTHSETTHSRESLLNAMWSMFVTEERHPAWERWGWPVGTDFYFATTCTDGARYLQRTFGGSVVGCYRTKINDDFGHDWLILGTLIVDYWAHYVADEEHATVLDMANAQDSLRIVELYGHPKDWETPHFQH